MEKKRPMLILRHKKVGDDPFLRFLRPLKGHVHKYDYQNVTLEKVAIVTELSTASIVLSVAQ